MNVKLKKIVERNIVLWIIGAIFYIIFKRDGLGGKVTI